MNNMNNMNNEILSLYKYMVPNIYNKKQISFTLHKTWKEANKYAKQRKVQMFSILSPLYLF